MELSNIPNMAAPFQGATGHSPAPWHSRQPHSRLALKLNKKRCQNATAGMASEMSCVSFLVFSWQPMFLDVFWISLWVFQSRRSTISTSSKKNKRWTMQPTPISTLDAFSINIWWSNLWRSGFSIYIFSINHLNKSPIIYVKTTMWAPPVMLVGLDSP